MKNVTRQQIDGSRTDEDKAIDALIEWLNNHWIGGKQAEDLISDIKAGKIHGVKWVGE